MQPKKKALGGDPEASLLPPPPKQSKICNLSRRKVGAGHVVAVCTRLKISTSERSIDKLVRAVVLGGVWWAPCLVSCWEAVHDTLAVFFYPPWRGT